MSFPLANHDGCFEVYVNNDEQFMVAWLEEQMFDVAEHNVCKLASIPIKET
jgi:hypothetical protein